MNFHCNQKNIKKLYVYKWINKKGLQNYYYIEVTNPPTQVNFGVVELVLVAFNIEREVCDIFLFKKY
jgi:hypothetical protein